MLHPVGRQIYTVLFRFSAFLLFSSMWSVLEDIKKAAKVVVGLFRNLVYGIREIFHVLRCNTRHGYSAILC